MSTNEDESIQVHEYEPLKEPCVMDSDVPEPSEADHEVGSHDALGPVKQTVSFGLGQDSKETSTQYGIQPTPTQDLPDPSASEVARHKVPAFLSIPANVRPYLFLYFCLCLVPNDDRHRGQRCTKFTYVKCELSEHMWNTHGHATPQDVVPNRPPLHDDEYLHAKCPHCEETGFTFYGLSTHLTEKHADELPVHRKYTHQAHSLPLCRSCAEIFSGDYQTQYRHMRSYHRQHQSSIPRSVPDAPAPPCQVSWSNA